MKKPRIFGFMLLAMLQVMAFSASALALNGYSVGAVTPAQSTYTLEPATTTTVPITFTFVPRVSETAHELYVSFDITSLTDTTSKDASIDIATTGTGSVTDYTVSGVALANSTPNTNTIKARKVTVTTSEKVTGIGKESDVPSGIIGLGWLPFAESKPFLLKMIFIFPVD